MSLVVQQYVQNVLPLLRPTLQSPPIIAHALPPHYERNVASISLAKYPRISDAFFFSPMLLDTHRAAEESHVCSLERGALVDRPGQYLSIVEETRLSQTARRVDMSVRFTLSAQEERVSKWRRCLAGLELPAPHL